MAKAPNWTNEEILLLAENYPKYGTNKNMLDIFPNRTAEGIRLKANRLGLKVLDPIRKARTNEEYIEYLEKNTDFVPLEQYKGSTVPILHLCGICDHEWKTRPQALLRENAKCPICYSIERKNNPIKVAQILNAAGMVLLSEYTGSLDPIVLRHNECGYEWTTKYSYIQQGSGCPKCNSGFGYIPGVVPEKATLYLLKIMANGETFLKIGVTTQPIHRRISSIKHEMGDINCSIVILHSITNTGKAVLNLENVILSNTKLIKYKTNMSFAGKTELLDITNNIDYILQIMNNENI